MTLKDEILKSGKLNPPLAAEIAGLDGNTDPDKPLFNLFVRLDSTQPLIIEGVDIQSNVPSKICIARNISLKGLKSLIDSPRVEHLSADIQMHPMTSKPSGPRPPF